MNGPNTAVKTLTRRLLAHEAGQRRDQEKPGVQALAHAAERTLDKLRLHLSKLLGPDGFRVLLGRAVILARTEFPWLEIVQPQSDGSLKGLMAASASITAAEALNGIAAVLAHLLGLLEAFIGQDLTLRLLQGVWPELAEFLHIDPYLHVGFDRRLSDDGTGGEGTGKE